MNVLIMVLSNRQDPYDKLEKAQRDTWDSVKVDGVQTYYYYGDRYNLMHEAFKSALNSVWRKKWDVIFRTNSSTYVCKDKIKRWAEENQPKSGLYAGFCTENMVSGSGILLTRDTAKILRDELPLGENPSEDTLIGTILGNHGIKPQPALIRKHFNFQEDRIEDADYYRCKSEIKMDGTFGYDNLDRNYDVIAMNKIFKHLH